MCGRYTSSVPKATLRERFQVVIPDGYAERYNVAPGQRVLAVRERDDGGRVAGMLRWGLVPRWAKDARVGFKMINARAETLAEKPAYRGLLRRHRCLIVADGFYEWWVGAGGAKEPVRFTIADGSPFAFAGLWTSWCDPDRGEDVVSCTVVTTRPNRLVAPVHDRMPVILRREDEALWLSAGVEVQQALALLGPYPAELMTAAPVSTRVNAASNEGPSLLADPAAAA